MPTSLHLPDLKTIFLNVSLLCAAFSVMLLPGCINTTESRPGVSGAYGTYETYLPGDQGAAWDATSVAARRLGLVVTRRDRPDEGVWVLEGRDAGANLTRIRVEPGTLESTRVTVHIDPGNNESMSLLTLKAVRDALED